MSFLGRVKNIFSKKQPVYNYTYYSNAFKPGSSAGGYFLGERSIINALYARMAIDTASVPIKHVQNDKYTGRFEKVINDNIEDILTVEANKDQTGEELILDILDKVFRYGYCAGVPYDFSDSTKEMVSMRTGLIKDWKPNSVVVDLYDDVNGIHRDIELDKDEVCIFVNPLYSVMNEPNSILQRLLSRLSELDSISDRATSGKLDIIIQLPYTLKTDLQRSQAAKRQAAIEDQIANSPYGIAYIDSSEHITQLNRPAENNLMSQIQYLTEMLYNQLGVTKAVFEGTADENQMINYYNRTIEPFLRMLVNEMNRKLLTKTARTQGQAIRYFANPFRLSSINNMAEMADKFVRNEILTKNEMRGQLGYQPSDDPAADQLRNPNLNASNNGDQINEFGEEFDESEFDEFEE